MKGSVRERWEELDRMFGKVANRIREAREEDFDFVVDLTGKGDSFPLDGW